MYINICINFCLYVEQLSCGTHELGTVTDSHCVDYTNVNHSSCSCVLYDRVHVYYMIEMFNLSRSKLLIVRNLTEILKPRNFNIIKIWGQRYQLHTIEASIDLRYTLWMKSLTMFSGDLHLLRQYKINFTHPLAFKNLVIEIYNAQKWEKNN